MSIWNGKYKSIKHIIEKVYRDNKAILKLDLYDAIEWAGECIELIGSPIQLLDKYECIKIEEFKGKLPCDLYLLLGTREEHGMAMRYSTDSFHHAKACKNINSCCNLNCDLIYTINDDYMFTSFKEGTVELAYKAIPTDSEGFPLIPDDIKFVKAVQMYITERLYWQALATGKIQQYMYERVDRERDWYIAAAQSRGNMPSVDAMESIKNNWIRLIPKINQHADFFKSAGEEEQRFNNSSEWNDFNHPTDTNLIR